LSERVNREEKEEEELNAKTQSRKGKAGEGMQEKGMQEKGLQERGRVKGKSSKGTDGHFFKITSGSGFNPQNIPCRSFFLPCVFASLRLILLFCLRGLAFNSAVDYSRPLTISLPARVVIAW
jgi:hypothetical protein